jgi:hypothetical protein
MQFLPTSQPGVRETPSSNSWLFCVLESAGSLAGGLNWLDLRLRQNRNAIAVANALS